MSHSRALLLTSLALIACGGAQPQAQTPATTDSGAPAVSDTGPRPPSLAEEQQAMMRDYTQQIAAAKAAIEEALDKSDCKACCESLNSMATASRRLCKTVLTDDDQQQCKTVQAQYESERERAEKACAPCPPPPEKRRCRRKR